MTRFAAFAIPFLLLINLSMLVSRGQDSANGTPAQSSDGKSAEPTDVASYRAFLQLRSKSEAIRNAAVKEIDEKWHPGSTTMLIEVIKFLPSKKMLDVVTGLVERKSGQDFGFQKLYPWHRWIWSQPYNPHPEYAEFKAEIYSHIDKTFPQHFQETANAQIRIDEIRWGGVKRDGIPPLKNLEMISVEEATYLNDSNVVFGVESNGEKRCYPKRILAWHEMYKDTIGGVSVCGVY